MLLAPNGHKSNLTEQQYKLVRTPAFKKWFGDFESYHKSKKIKLENGRLFFDGKDIGIFEISKHNGYVEIDRLYINEEYQKEGIGKACMFYIFDNYSVDIIEVYPHPATENFWIRIGVSNVKPDGVFQMKRENFSCSKSVDENGEPIIFYHGTTKDFNVFGEGREKIPFSNAHRVFYFSKNKDYAKTFGSKFGGKDLPVFLNIKKIKIADKDVLEDVGYWATEKDLDSFSLQGYDALSTYNFEQVAITSSPSNIKLADGSNTTFDVNNPDIRYAGGGKFTLPENHKPFLKVPKGGSSCANCKFLSEDKLHCVQKHFVEWYGTSKLPQPIDEYCSDWYEPNEEMMAKGGELKFYSDCVGYPVLSDLEHIIDKEKEITYKTFVANVNKEDRLMLEQRLGYGKHFPITKDWHVRFFRSKDEDNNTVYFMRHSAIEYVFSPKSSGMFCSNEDDYKNGGKLNCDFDKQTKSCSNACNMENGGQLPSIIKYARIKPIREGGEERIVRVSPDEVGGYVAGYVVYYPAKSNNKVAYFNKAEFKLLLDDGSYTLFNTLEQAQSSKPMEIDIDEQLKIRQRMRSLLKLLKYKTTDESGITKEDKFIDRVIQLIYDGKDFKSKSDIERIAENEFGFEDKRKVRELTEYAVLSVGRDISRNYGNNILVAYKKMVSLYSNQPYSTHRTGTSVNLGQFSTPLPMAYLMGCYVGINVPSENNIYFEPTGGNGSLTVAGNVQDFVINELDMHRYNNLLKENYKLVLNQDATKKFDFDFKFDGMLANPPFATTKTDIIVGGFHISGLEQQIIVNSLMYLKDKAKTAFIIGGHTEFDEEGRIKSKKDRAFLSYLFKHYYMDDVININGSLYGRQGTTYPIRIILLAAKKSEPNGFYPLRNEALGKFEPFSVKVIDTFDELFKRTEKYIQKSL